MLLDRVLCVTLNSAIDQTYYFDKIHVGGINRPCKTISQAGGKGNNVARVISRLGGNVLATGFIAGKNGRFIEESMTKEGIPHSFYRLPNGESRNCLAIMDKNSKDTTEILEQGLSVNEDEVNAFSNHLEELIDMNMVVVFSGSLPIGVTIKDFNNLINLANTKGAKVIIDSSGEALKAATQNNIFSIMPNEYELRVLSSDLINVPNKQYEMQALVSFFKKGIKLPIVTLGRDGAIIYDGKDFYQAEPPRVSVVNTVGSGDSFLGGFVYGLMNGQSVERSLAIATAAGAANAETYSAGMVNKNRVLELSKTVRIKKLLIN